ncbi:MAG: response regulator [bacterium]
MSWRHDVLDDAGQIADHVALKDVLPSSLAALTAAQSQAILATLTPFLRHQHYTDGLLADAAGLILVHSAGATGELCGAQRDALQAALRTGQPVLGNFEWCEKTQAPCLSVVAPVRGMIRGNPAATHAIILRIDPRVFLYPLIKLWPVVSRTAETVIAQREGDRMVVLNDLRFQTNTAMRLSIPLSQARAAYVMAAAGRAGAYSALDYRGIPVLAVLAKVPGSSWVMSTEEDQSEVFEAWHAQAWLIVLLVFMLLAGALLVSALFWQREQKDALTRLYRAEIQERAAQQTFRESEERYRLLAANSRDIILQIRAEDAQIVEANPSAVAAYGYCREELLALTIYNLRETGQHAGVASQMAQAAAGRGLLFETVHRRKDGSVFPVEVSTQGTRVDGQTVLISVIRDITVRKQAEAQLKQAREELEQRVEERTRQLSEAQRAADAASRAKSAFLASMSHEIRTPLHAILGYAQLLRRDAAVPAAFGEKLAIIQRSGDHLLELINGVLEMAKIEAGRISIEPAPFDLHALLDDLIAMLRLRTVAKGLELRLVRSEDCIRYGVADAGRIRQILVNLCGNAVKFTDHGHVELRAASRTDLSGRVWLELEVEDTGIGVAVADSARLFGQFEQARSGQPHETGAGLGLTISREYARLMGGDITLTSREGQGSTFRVAIPIRVSDAAGVAEKKPARQVTGLDPGQGEMRVLVVDDNGSNRDWLTSFLQQVGCEVREADSGAAAVRVWAEWKPQLVLMDLRMPDMDGCETTRRIKEQPGGDETVVIALTASALDGDFQQARASGMVDLLTKPLEVSELFEKMARYLGLRFRYAGEAAVPDAKTAPPLTPERLAGLPQALRDRLLQAVGIGEKGRIDGVLQEIAGIDPQAADALRALADQYDYDRLVSLLNREGKT